MRIELCGLPATGKSTLSQKISEERGLKRIAVRGPVGARLLGAIFCVLHPKLFFLLRALIRRENEHHPELLRYKSRTLFWSYIASEQQARLHGSCVVDQGIVHSVLSIYERRIEREDLEWLDLFLRGESIEILILEAPRDVREERKVARKGWPRRRFGEDYRRKWQAVLEFNHEVLKKELPKRYSCTVIQSG